MQILIESYFLSYLNLNSNISHRSKIDEDGIESEELVVDVKIKSHIPEILPVYGKRFNVWYPGIPKQCKTCFDFDHTAKTCKSQKLPWLDYVAKIHEVGKIKDELLGSWLDTLKKYHSNYKPGPQIDLRAQLDANKRQLEPDDLRRNIQQPNNRGQRKPHRGHNYRGRGQSFTGYPNQDQPSTSQDNRQAYRQDQDQDYNHQYRGRGQYRGRVSYRGRRGNRWNTRGAYY